MSIIPVSYLSRHDLRLLGNNVIANGAKPSLARPTHQRAQLAAVNRSLAVVGERVTALHRR